MVLKIIRVEPVNLIGIWPRGSFELTDISILMPCHNEMHSIKRNIKETADAMKKLDNGPYEIIVIDDGSSDSTFNEITAGAKDNDNVRFVKLVKNHGKGHALRKGFECAKGKYICFLDGDLDLHPKLLKEFFKIMNKEDADVVIGSKRHPESVVNYPLNRTILSRFYQRLLGAMFGMSLTDSQVGLKLFKREVLENIFHRVTVKKYAFDIELLINAHHCGFKIVEAPIEMDFIDKFGSDVNLRAIVRMFIDTCAIFYRLNITHYYDFESPNFKKPKKVLMKYLYYGNTSINYTKAKSKKIQKEKFT